MTLQKRKYTRGRRGLQHYFRTGVTSLELRQKEVESFTHKSFYRKGLTFGVVPRSFRPGQFSLVHSISKSTKMDPKTFMDVATVITKLKMYPYFDVAHMILCCLAVRDDIVPQGEKPTKYAHA